MTFEEWWDSYLEERLPDLDIPRRVMWLESVQNAHRETAIRAWNAMAKVAMEEFKKAF